jgi:hypothetical protein
MPNQAKYLFVVSMDVDPAKEALFNEVYDKEHVPLLMKVPGVYKVTRAAGQDFNFSMGGKQEKKTHSVAKYIAIYELESPDVVSSKEWATAVEVGRWPGEVRPFTHNRSHAMYKIG